MVKAGSASDLLVLRQVAVAALPKDVYEGLEVVLVAQHALALVRALGQQQRLWLDPHVEQALEHRAHFHKSVVNSLGRYANALQSMKLSGCTGQGHYPEDKCTTYCDFTLSDREHKKLMTSSLMREVSMESTPAQAESKHTPA